MKAIVYRRFGSPDVLEVPAHGLEVDGRTRYQEDRGTRLTHGGRRRDRLPEHCRGAHVVSVASPADGILLSMI